MNDSSWLENYLARYREILSATNVFTDLVRIKSLLQVAKADGRKVMLAGNGASASIASHLAVDLTKQAGVQSLSFNEANLITAFANDYGYENWVAEAIRRHGQPEDVVILISSSGRSPNMVTAGKFAATHGFNLVTLSGFAPDNPLRTLGMVNLWVDSRAYNIVECVHMIWLTAICDLIIGSAEYPAV
ncbi:MAG TPA: SIS domain-containing protein [Candidatus Methylacidiphilales bacterium]|nr:SIS domain-containing protein [Candidatus Methylacidiphilales bacterium]